MTAGVCPFCFEACGPTGHANDKECANALGKAIGAVTRATHLRAKKAWVCPPMPMPEKAVVVAEPPPAAVEAIAEPEATVLVVVPPLNAREITRAAAFILTGKIKDVMDAEAAVRETAWPTDPDAAWPGP